MGNILSPFFVAFLRMAKNKVSASTFLLLLMWRRWKASFWVRAKDQMVSLCFVGGVGNCKWAAFKEVVIIISVTTHHRDQGK